MLALLELRASELVEYRGYTDVSASDTQFGKVLRGKDLPEDHPYHGGEIIVLVSNLVKYKGDKLRRSLHMMRALANEIVEKELSCLMIVLQFLPSAPNMTVIMETMLEVTVTLQVFNIFEMIVDHRRGRITSNWRIVKPEQAELLPGISIDHAPRIQESDIKCKYIGARSGDFVMYDNLEIGDAGPRSYTELRLVIGLTIDSQGSYDPRL